MNDSAGTGKWGSGEGASDAASSGESAYGAGATFEDFVKLDIRAACVLAAEPLAGARKPALLLRLDCGPDLGERVSTAQLTELYEPANLVGRLVLAVVNFPPRRVASVKSECLTLGVYNSGGAGRSDGAVTLIVPDGAGNVQPGDRLG